ncbi:Vps53-like protein [Endogone sp. FLAS-F59071]|nr:Vps53-like protein [Endogone sp. FLAS-F59071]|eukprot:RUS20036.1 Vps53-like protein [Endogone sp. FLAS-F59071]
MEQDELRAYFEDFYVDSFRLSPELDNALSTILDTKDPLDSLEFNPIEYINRMFPNEQSLASLDEILSKLKQKMRQLDEHTKELARKQSDAAAQECVQELEAAKKAIQDLFAKIRQIKEKATQSETMVQEITRDIKSLDYAKRHLTSSITALKRLQMLGRNQLQHTSKSYGHGGRSVAGDVRADTVQRECAAAAGTLPFLNIEIVNNCWRRPTHVLTRASLKLPNCLIPSAKFKPIWMPKSPKNLRRGTFNRDGALISQTWVLHDACLVANVLGDPMRVVYRNRLVGWYVDLQLRDYRSVFQANEEVAALDNVSRRYAWLKRLLKICDEEHAEIFPPAWNVSECLCERFCEYTRKDLSDVLAKSSNTDVKTLLKALQLTIEWESQLSKRFLRLQHEQVDSQEPGSKFAKSISSCFEPYLGLYIDAEDKKLSEMINTYKIKPHNSEEDASAVVLSSSTDLFYHYRETLVQCAKLSTGKPFLDLCRLFGKYLVIYANGVLIGKLLNVIDYGMKMFATSQSHRDDKRAVTLEDIRLMCLILNTGDYCCATISSLEERLKEKIDENLKEQVSLEKERETFLNTVSICVRALVRGVDNCYEPWLAAMARISWATVDSVGDQSSYVSKFQSTLTECVGIIGKMMTNKRYFRTFCDKHVESFVAKYLNNIIKCRHISEVGAEQVEFYYENFILLVMCFCSNRNNTSIFNIQMLLDTHAIKTALLEMHSMGPDANTPMPTTFAKFVNKGISKAEAILKVVMTPQDPMDGFIENYIFLIGDRNTSNFQKILDLKVMSTITFTPTSGPNVNPSTLPMSIQSSLNTIASSASNFSPSQLPQLSQLNLAPALSSASAGGAASQSGELGSPTQGTGQTTGTRTGKFNENFRKLVLTGMSFRRDLQERREKQEAHNKDRD